MTIRHKKTIFRTGFRKIGLRKISFRRNRFSWSKLSKTGLQERAAHLFSDTFKNSLAHYFNSWWIPSTICILLIPLSLFAYSLLILYAWPLGDTLAPLIFLCNQLAFMGLVGAIAWHFTKSRYSQGFISLLMGTLYVSLFYCTVVRLFLFVDSFQV